MFFKEKSQKICKTCDFDSAFMKMMIKDVN